MSPVCQPLDSGVLVRFWSLDHHQAEEVLWPTSPWDKLVYAVQGMVEVQTEGRVHLLSTSKALAVPAGQPHPARTLGRARVRTLYFSPSLGFPSEPRVLEVRPFFRELILEACSVGPLLAKDPVHQAAALLLLREAESASSVPSSIPMPRSAWLKQWAEAFLRDPAVEASPGYSKRTMERVMLSETGLTLGQWRTQARVLVGLRSLFAGSSVLEAGDEAGFQTTSGFIQSFKRQLGTTPGKFVKEGWEGFDPGGL